MLKSGGMWIFDNDFDFDYKLCEKGKTMKLFNDFEAVKFSEENMIFVTNKGFLYYIYNPKYKFWRKHKNVGNDSITVSNYADVSKEELQDAMHGIFPRKETDFMRLCNPSQLWIRDMLDLLEDDYPKYMSDYSIANCIHRFLLESDVCYKSFLSVKKVLDDALFLHQDSKHVLIQIKELCLTTIGSDIFKREIGIVDGHDSSSYFWIMPVKVIDYSDTNCTDNVAEMRSAEISIEEDDVSQYLTPFLYKYYEDALEANKRRVDDRWIDDAGTEQTTFVSGFVWCLTHNFFTFSTMMDILKDIRDTADALSSGGENEFTVKLREKRGTATYELLYARDLSEEQIKEYNANRPKEDNTKINLIIDFYHRFIYRMEYMMRIGKEKGYDLISFMGP